MSSGYKGLKLSGGDIDTIHHLSSNKMTFCYTMKLAPALSKGYIFIVLQDFLK